MMMMMMMMMTMMVMMMMILIHCSYDNDYKQQKDNTTEQKQSKSLLLSLFKLATQTQISGKPGLYRESSTRVAWLPKTDFSESTPGEHFILHTVSSWIVVYRHAESCRGCHCSEFSGKHFKRPQCQHFKCTNAFCRHNDSDIFNSADYNRHYTGVTYGERKQYEIYHCWLCC